MTRSVRIGGAGGFWGDSAFGMEQLVAKGNVDYIVSDYLAELTLAIMAKQKQRDPGAGFATDFVTLTLKPLLRDIVEKKICIITNAGGINPRACAQALQALADSVGVKIKVGIVEGDDLMPIEQSLREKNTVEMFTGAPLPEKITSMNAYIGAFPIAAALHEGANIVITGRCADSALALGALIHEFGWGVDDYDLLAAGSMAGHLIECGTQTTGGLFTDWHLVPGRADLGYPIVECYPDGQFNLTKPRETGGLITPLVAIEQLLYEVGDPRNYLLPDVSCDLTGVKVAPIDTETVRLAGFGGRAPSSTYKVSAIYLDGYRCSATLTMIGQHATQKGSIVGQALIERTRAILRRSNLGDFSETNIEVLGSERAAFGENARNVDPRESVLRISVRHPRREALELFSREIAPFGTAGTPGTTGFSGRPKPQEVYRLFSFLVDKTGLNLTVEVDGKAVEYDNPKPTKLFEHAEPLVSPIDVPRGKDAVSVPLRSIAVARSGDKADISHLAIIARHEIFYSVLLEQLTEERLKDYFAHLAKGPVSRFEVPGTNALIFMLHDALGGGGTASLRSDALGKAFGEIALDMEVSVPKAWLALPDFQSRQGIAA